MAAPHNPYLLARHLASFARRAYALVQLILLGVIATGLSVAQATTPDKTAPAIERLELSVDLGSGVEIPADIFLPRMVSPKALVLVVPGSDGQADPFVGIEIMKPTYDPDHRGGWLQPMLRAGYAVAFFSDRGYRRLRHCITGETPEERARSFADRCVIGNVRAGVTLYGSTQDVAKVMSAIAAHSRLRRLTPIVLAISLGLHHTSVIVGQGRFAPAAVVGVGGAHPDLRTIMQYQADRMYFVRALERAFHACPGRRLSVDDVMRCAEQKSFPLVAEMIHHTMGADTMDAIEFEHRRGFWAGAHHRDRAFFMNLPPQAVLGGRLNNASYPMGWSSRHFVQLYESGRPVLQQFGNFTGPLILLYGTGEFLMPLPKAGPCGHRRPDRRALDCEVRHLQGLGHGLNDESGYSPPWAIAEIVRALDQGLARFQAKANAAAR